MRPYMQRLQLLSVKVFKVCANSLAVIPLDATLEQKYSHHEGREGTRRTDNREGIES